MCSGESIAKFSVHVLPLNTHVETCEAVDSSLRGLEAALDRRSASETLQLLQTLADYLPRADFKDCFGNITAIREYTFNVLHDAWDFDTHPSAFRA